MSVVQTMGWAKYSHEQFGLPSWGASGPYKQVYEKFGLTGDNLSVVGKKVVSFYKKKGGEVISPLVNDGTSTFLVSLTKARWMLVLLV